MTKKIISLEVSEALKEALRVEAFNASLTVSALIRKILEANLPVHNTKLKTLSSSKDSNNEYQENR